jgi:hypothetical protein
LYLGKVCIVSMEYINNRVDHFLSSLLCASCLHSLKKIGDGRG